MNKSILRVVHEGAKDLHEIGLMDDVTMREFDMFVLTAHKKIHGESDKKIRMKNKASQAVFAAFLNISPSTVQQWEQGLKKLNGASLRLLNLVDTKGLAGLM